MIRALTVLVALASLGACAGRIPDKAWADYEAALLAEGKLRTDRAAKDIPFDRADLADHFGKVAFGIDPEFARDRTEAALAESQIIRKWRGPIRFRIYGHPSPPDRRWIVGMFGRLPGLTGLDIAEATEGAEGRPNFLVFFLDQKQRIEVLQSYDPRGDDLTREEMTDLFSDTTTCSTSAIYPSAKDDPDYGVIYLVAASIRAELPDRMRTSCIEEEIVQSMGLIRDDDSVRPSIFNEDEEFAYMTRHDEYLLRILYDPRLTPGMPRDRAMPIVRQIVGELELDG